MYVYFRFDRPSPDFKRLIRSDWSNRKGVSGAEFSRDLSSISGGRLSMLLNMLTELQNRDLKLISEGQNIVVTVKAGTGKS